MDVRLSLFLVAVLPAGAAAQVRVAPPAAFFSGAAAAAAPLSPPAPGLLCLSLPAPSIPPAPALPLPAAAPVPAVRETETSLVLTPSVAEGLAALRAASHESHPLVAELVARIKEARPDLPISVDNLFMVRDRGVLDALGIPEEAAGAARILTDGTTEAPVVILVAVRPVGVDAFVEFAVHEAVHLKDDGILRARHDEELKHFFAEGWTQKRAVAAANEILAALGRPATPGKAYRKEIALVDAFIAAHGSAALDRLVRDGSDDALRAALGERWEAAEKIASGGGGRERRLDGLIALIAR